MTESNELSIKRLNVLTGSDSFFAFFTIGEGGVAEDALSAYSGSGIVMDAGACICLSGSCRIMIDQQSYTVNKGEMFTIFPYTLFRTLFKSDDFTGLTVAVDMEFLTLLNIKSQIKLYMGIKQNPLVLLSDDEVDMLVKLSRNIGYSYARSTAPLRMEITVSLLTAFCYEIASLYLKKGDIENVKRSRKEYIFQRFIVLITSNCHKNRNLGFYAEKLFLHPQYLSSVIKEMSGITASEWIARTTIVNAKKMLQDPKLSILEISYRLNFPNPSSFGKYFKHYTGQTPGQFRNSPFIPRINLQPVVKLAEE